MFGHSHDPIVPQLAPLVGCAIFGMGLILIAYSFAT